MALFSKPKYSKVVVKSREGVPKGVFTKCPETGDMVFAKELKKRYKLPLDFIDERLSSWEAGALLREAGICQKKSKTKIDSQAAVLILDTWLQWAEMHNES